MLGIRSTSESPRPVPLNPAVPILSPRYNVANRSDSVRHKPDYLPGGNTRKGDLDIYMHNLGGLPPLWEQHVHPDGKPYFCHSQRNIVTEANIRDHSTLMKLENWYNLIISTKSTDKDVEASPDWELYLTLDPNGYYYVDHANQSVYWLQDIHLSMLPIDSNSSFEIWLLQNYYAHLENFPCHRTVPTDAKALLRGALAYACTDHLTSYKSATSPWNAADCKTLLDLLEGMGDEIDTTSRNAPIAYNTWFIARLLCVMYSSRSVHHYGMLDACTDRLEHVQSSRDVLPGVFGLVAGALSFWAHPTYVARLDIVWAGGMVSLSGWQELLDSLLVEWSESNLLATVILSANMAFLALSDVGPSELASSVISTFFSIGSIAVGLHHIWRHRVKKDSQLGDAAMYLSHATKSQLAFFLSIPLTFFLWSLVTFGFAVAIFTFSHSRPWGTYAFTGTIFSAVIYIIFHTVFFFFSIFRRIGG